MGIAYWGGLSGGNIRRNGASKRDAVTERKRRMEEVCEMVRQLPIPAVAYLLSKEAYAAEIRPCFVHSLCEVFRAKIKAADGYRLEEKDRRLYAVRAVKEFATLHCKWKCRAARDPFLN